MVWKFIQECKRVFKVTRKPTGTEFKKVFLVTSVGILLIGFIGFVVLLVFQSLF
ncbi:MAG: protein translocase SEC61 complex subunit gamma [Candidatus Woesearchaeota archaeon]